MHRAFMRPSLSADLAVPFNLPFTRADLEAAGLPLSALRYWLDHDHAFRLCRGVYAPASFPGIAATRATAGGSRCLSIRDGAIAQGLWLPPDMDRSLRSVIRMDRISAALVTKLGVLNSPTRGWAAVQLAKRQPLALALIPLDSALRLGESLCSLQNLAEHVPGVGDFRHLEAALALADGRSESPLESLTRGRLIEAGLPLPLLQASISCRGRRYRVDFLWPDNKLILEADGKVKYTNGEDLWLERNRQRDLERAGYEVLRCIWADVAEPGTAFLRRLAARFVQR